MTPILLSPEAVYSTVEFSLSSRFQRRQRQHRQHHGDGAAAETQNFLLRFDQFG
jgi:hypothetical protein